MPLESPRVLIEKSTDDHTSELEFSEPGGVDDVGNLCGSMPSDVANLSTLDERHDRVAIEGIVRLSAEDDIHWDAVSKLAGRAHVRSDAIEMVRLANH
jgi:hypothetical protein